MPQSSNKTCEVTAGQPICEMQDSSQCDANAFLQRQQRQELIIWMAENNTHGPKNWHAKCCMLPAGLADMPRTTMWRRCLSSKYGKLSAFQAVPSKQSKRW